MVIATGYFDGVHLGHQAIINSLCSYARLTGDKSMVITFYPHPRAVLQKDASQLRFLSSRSERQGLLESLGVDRVEEVNFTREFASLTACEYIDFLRSEFDLKALVLGYDNRFGSDGLLNEELSQLLESKGVVVLRPQPVEVGEMVVSSSSIRRLLSDGDVAFAARMLGRQYSLTGVVVSGNRLGRTLGFPTANMSLYDPLKIVPASGVYAVRVHVLGRSFLGMTNIGVRPTVSSEGSALTIETNIFDFDEDIYGLDITIEFLQRVRSEQKFASLSDLTQALANDKASILALCS